jgi:hypothetical protein
VTDQGVHPNVTTRNGVTDQGVHPNVTTAYQHIGRNGRAE